MAEVAEIEMPEVTEPVVEVNKTAEPSTSIWPPMGNVTVTLGNVTAPLYPEAAWNRSDIVIW